MSETTKQAIAALLVGASGAVGASLAAMPAAPITGPAIAVALAGLAGIKCLVPNQLRDIVFVVLGMMIGSGISPEVFVAARQWPASFGALALVVFIIMWVSRRGLSRWFAMDNRTALLAGAPGHLSYVLGLGMGSGGDIAKISVVQSIRLLALTLLVPLFVSFSTSGLTPALPPPSDMPPLVLAPLAAVSALFGLVLHRMRLPAGLLIGGMAVSTIAHVSGAVSGSVPDWLAFPALAVMGTLIGSRFSGVTLAALRRCALAGLFTTAVAAMASFSGAMLVSLATGLPLALMLIAFAPGGLETMSAIALLTGSDPAFVAAHHVFRLFLLTGLLPLMLGEPGTASSRN